TVNDTEDPDQSENTDDQWNADQKPRQQVPPQPRHQSHCAHIATRISMPAAIRYQANGAKPDRDTYRRNGLTTKTAATNAVAKPMAISIARSGARWSRTSHRS